MLHVKFTIPTPGCENAVTEVGHGNRPENSNKTLWKGVGLSDDDLTRPISHRELLNEIVPEYMNRWRIAEQVKRGVYCAGGTLSSLAPSPAATDRNRAFWQQLCAFRDNIADSVETGGHRPQAGDWSCLARDKIVPGMLMAAASEYPQCHHRRRLHTAASPSANARR